MPLVHKVSNVHFVEEPGSECQISTLANMSVSFALMSLELSVWRVA